MHRCEEDRSGPVQCDRRRGRIIAVLSHCRRVGVGSLRDFNKAPKGGRYGTYLDEEVSERLVDRLPETTAVSTQLGTH